jgi:multiple sugar transport system substrate-binding protein
VVGTYAARGAIAPLDDCLEQQDVDMSAFRGPAADQVSVDGSVYGLPEFFAVRVVIADTDALGQAGLTLDQVATGDWDAITAANQALSQREGPALQRVGYDPRLPETLPLWSAANGGALLSDDGRTAQLDSPEVVEALESTAALVEAAGGWSAVSAFRDSWDFFGEQNQYATDQVGAMPMENWYVNQLSEVGTAGWAVAPFLDREGEPLTWATGQAWAVPEGAENPDEACEFAATMTAADTWVTAATARAQALRDEGSEYTGPFTGNVEADERIFSEVYEPVQDPALDAAIETVIDLQDDARSMPPSPAAAEVKDAYQDAVVRVLNGEQDAATSLAQAQEAAQRAIDEAAGD